TSRASSVGPAARPRRAQPARGFDVALQAIGFGLKYLGAQSGEPVQAATPITWFGLDFLDQAFLVQLLDDRVERSGSGADEPARSGSNAFDQRVPVGGFFGQTQQQRVSVVGERQKASGIRHIDSP